MTAIDYLLLAIILVSMVISLFRGFVKEALSLVSWLVAIWAAARFGSQFGEIILGSFDSETIRSWGGRTALLIAVLFAGGVVSWLISQLLDSTGLSGTDRAIGMVFGLVRGVILAAVVLLMFRFAGFSESSWWTDSKLIPYVAPVAEMVVDAAEEGIEYLDVDEDEVIDATAEKAGELLVR